MKKLLVFVCALFAVANLSAQRIAVLEFNAGVGVSLNDVNGISAIFNTHFSPKGYTLVERTQIDRVIDEQKFQRGNLTQEQMVRIGQILNVSKVVVGNISIVMDQYNVDVRVVNVESGTISAKEGATWIPGSIYRGMMEELASRLANKIAINPVVEPIVVEKPTPRERKAVEIVLGYLKVYPTELGIFPFEPTSVIAQINRQHMYDYDSWRIPTVEELALLRANNYLSSETYMTTASASSSGVVLLVTDDLETYSQKQQKKKNVKPEPPKVAEKIVVRDTVYVNSSPKPTSVKTQPSQPTPTAKPKQKRKLAPIKKGYEQEVSFAFSYMEDPPYTYSHSFISMPLCINYVGGYRFNHHFYIGLGTGLDIDCGDVYTGNYYTTVGWDYRLDDLISDFQIVSVPLYAHFKAYFMKTKWSPFFAFSGGVRLSAPKELEVYELYDLGTFYDYIRTEKFGGVSGMFETMLGVSYRHSKKFGFNFQFGYATRSGLYEWTNRNVYGDWIEDYQVRKNDMWLHGFTLRFGVVF